MQKTFQTFEKEGDARQLDQLEAERRVYAELKKQVSTTLQYGDTELARIWKASTGYMAAPLIELERFLKNLEEKIRGSHEQTRIVTDRMMHPF